MSEIHEIRIPRLLAISEKLVNQYFVTDDIYGIVALSYMSVLEYGRKHNSFRIKTQARIEMSINLLPQLIDHLRDKDLIDSGLRAKLLEEYHMRFDELPSILENYIQISNRSCRSKSKPANQKEHKCVIL